MGPDRKGMSKVSLEVAIPGASLHWPGSFPVRSYFEQPIGFDSAKVPPGHLGSMGATSARSRQRSPCRPLLPERDNRALTWFIRIA
jgi:hypothetical protein